MERIKNQETEMVFHQGAGSVLGITILWTTGSLLFPLITYLRSGTDTITCDRIEPTIVNCEIRQSRPGNLFASPPQTIETVRQAFVDEEMRESDDGDYMVYRVSFLTGDGEFHPVSPFQRGGTWEHSIANQMNTLLPGNTPDWELTRPQGPSTLFMLGITVLFIALAGVGLYGGMTSAQTLTLTLDKPRRKGTYTVKTPFGWRDRTVEYNFSDLTVKLQEYEDEYGKKHPRLEFLANDGEVFYRQHASTFASLQPLANELRNFLGLPPETISASRDATHQSAPPRSTLRVFYCGKSATFSSRELLAMSNTVDEASSTAAQDLESLAFQFLGDLYVESLPGWELYGFANPRQATYAVIISGIKHGIDFYTTFADGTSLTTTNMDVATRQMKSKKIYRYSYPDIDVANLLRKHQNHLTELMQTHGKPNPVKADLKAIAIAIDEYLVREASAKPMLFGIQL